MKISKKIILATSLITLSLILPSKSGLNSSMVMADTILKAGVSLVDRVPHAVFGTWRVSAVLKDTDSRGTFREKSVDLWNLSRKNDVMNLNNPVTGASANLSVNEVRGSSVKFTKESVTDNKKLTDTVEINLSGDTFVGVNTIEFSTLSDIDGSVIKTEHAFYALTGKKISGASVLEK